LRSFFASIIRRIWSKLSWCADGLRDKEKMIKSAKRTENHQAPALLACMKCRIQHTEQK
jgi:hypothetical protein